MERRIPRVAAKYGKWRAARGRSDGGAAVYAPRGGGCGCHESHAAKRRPRKAR